MSGPAAGLLSVLLTGGQTVENEKGRGGDQHTQHGHGHAQRHAALLELPVDVGGDHQGIGRGAESGPAGRP